VCGASPVERLFSPVAVHFKGSGFYSTDYGRGKKRETGKDGDGGGTETKKPDETKAPATSSPGSTSSSGSTSPAGD
jgi:predicted nucleic acid-binding Zn ribbon protein